MEKYNNNQYNKSFEMLQELFFVAQRCFSTSFLKQLSKSLKLLESLVFVMLMEKMEVGLEEFGVSYEKLSLVVPKIRRSVFIA